MKRSWGVSTGMDPHIRATCTSYEYMSPADACHVWLKAVTFTVLVRLVKSKRSASDLVPYHISAQLILLTYYSRYIGGTAVDSIYSDRCSALPWSTLVILMQIMRTQDPAFEGFLRR